jgi:hypothetical protein
LYLFAALSPVICCRYAVFTPATALLFLRLLHMSCLSRHMCVFATPRADADFSPDAALPMPLSSSLRRLRRRANIRYAARVSITPH